jgi:hypothetical protein
MPVVKGPNGVKFDFSDDVAAALLKNDGYELVKPRGKAKPADEGDAAE